MPKPSNSAIHLLGSIGLIALLAASGGAGAQSVEAARAARDRARAELGKAQEAFDRADEAYINALGGAAARAPANTVSPTAASPAGPAPMVSQVTPTWVFGSPHGRVVTFAMAGPAAEGENPLDYRGRLVVDGQASAWTQHVSGARNLVSSQASTLAYEIQRNESRDSDRPAWKTLCEGQLPLKNAVTLEIVVAKSISCNVR